MAKTFFQGLSIIDTPSGDDEMTGNWQTVLIPVSEAFMASTFATRTTYTLRNLQAGAVYDVIAKAKNKYGWSDQSKTFNFFNKGVGKSYWWLSSNLHFASRPLVPSERCVKYLF